MANNIATITPVDTGSVGHPQTVTEAGYAMTRFNLTPSLSSATVVGATLVGTGTSTSDFTGFQYSMGDSGIWLNVNSPSEPTSTLNQFTINAGFNHFFLRTYINADNAQETGEAVTFTVSQLTTSIGLENSWNAASTWQLADPSFTAVSFILDTTNATIVAPSIVADVKVEEGHTAYALYNIVLPGTSTGAALASNPFTSTGNTVVNVGVAGIGSTQGATTAFDFGTLYYRASTDGTVFGTADLSTTTTGWAAVPTTGQISLIAGTTKFELGVFVNNDANVEIGEGLVFTASQTVEGATLQGSWYVGGTVNLFDPGAAGSNHAVTPVSISLDARNKTGAVDQINIDEGHAATAKFDLSGTTGLGGVTGTFAGNTQITYVDVSVAGVGATQGTTGDFGALYYHVDSAVDNAASYEHTVATSGVATGMDLSYWTAAPSNGMVPLAIGTKSFELGVFVHNDAVVETGEAVTFSVSQQANSITLTDSWYVSGTVNIFDQGSVGSSTPVVPVKVVLDQATNKTLVSGVWVDHVNVDEGHVAIAKFDLVNPTSLASSPLDGVGGSSAQASTWLDVSVAGVGATQGTLANGHDFGDLYYRLDNYAREGIATVSGITGLLSPAVWERVSTTTGDLHKGQVMLPYGVTSFELGVMAHSDGVFESGEAVTFTVSQLANSLSITDSWYVSGTVNLIDPGTSPSNTFIGGEGADLFVATSGDDVFVIPANTSILDLVSYTTAVGGSNTAAQFDTISNLDKVHDKINVGLFDNNGAPAYWTSHDYVDEAGVRLAIVNNAALTGNAVGGISFYKAGADGYVFADTYQAGHVDWAHDTFIKIVGGGGLTSSEVQTIFSF